MPKSTDAKVSLVMAELRARRQRGEIAPGEPVSIRFMERVSHEINQPVSQRTFARLERVILTKMKIQLQSILTKTPNEN